MNRVDCPTCQTSYTFQTLGLVAPNEVHAIVEARTVCKVCLTEINFSIQWTPTKTKHVDNWWRRTIYRLPPSAAYEYRIAVKIARAKDHTRKKKER